MNQAIVISATPGSLPAYFSEWKKDLKFDGSEYVLCDLGLSSKPNLNIDLEFTQNNLIYYNKQVLREELNFNVEPSSKHRWNEGGGRSIIWFYPHLRFLYFYLLHREYEYYWFLDDDITFPENQLYRFLELYDTNEKDCLITYLFSNNSNENKSGVPFMDQSMGSYHGSSHNWLTHYPGAGDRHNKFVKETYGSFFPIVRLSRKSMELLLSEHNNGWYGYSEGYVPTTLNYYGCSLESIYNTQSRVAADTNIVIHHKNWKMLWENV